MFSTEYGVKQQENRTKAKLTLKFNCFVMSIPNNSSPITKNKISSYRRSYSVFPDNSSLVKDYKEVSFEVQTNAESYRVKRTQEVLYSRSSEAPGTSLRFSKSPNINLEEASKNRSLVSLSSDKSQVVIHEDYSEKFKKFLDNALQENSGKRISAAFMEDPEDIQNAIISKSDIQSAIISNPTGTKSSPNLPELGKDLRSSQIFVDPVVQNDDVVQPKSVNNEKPQGKQVEVAFKQNEEPACNSWTKRENVIQSSSMNSHDLPYSSFSRTKLEVDNSSFAASKQFANDLSEKPSQLEVPTKQETLQCASLDVKSNLEKYTKMQKCGLPQGAIENAMLRDGLDPSLLFGVNALNKLKTDDETFKRLTEDDPNLEKYKKMKKCGLPQGAIENAMMREFIHPASIFGENALNDPKSKPHFQISSSSKKIDLGNKPKDLKLSLMEEMKLKQEEKRNRPSLQIDEKSFVKDHPSNQVSSSGSNLIEEMKRRQSERAQRLSTGNKSGESEVRFSQNSIPKLPPSTDKKLPTWVKPKVSSSAVVTTSPIVISKNKEQNMEALVQLLIQVKISAEDSKQYVSALAKEGFDSPDKLSLLDEADLQACGITRRFDKKAILSLRNLVMN